MDIPKYYHDLNEIRDGLYLGSRRAEHSLPLAVLQEFYGITHVVQVGTDDFMSPTHAGSLKYCCVRALDFEGEDLLTKLKDAEVHGFIDVARSNGGKVLVHCFAGVSRSATTVISYLMDKQPGLTFEEALSEVIAKRKCVAPNRGFCDQLRILQDQCHGHLESYTPQMLQDHHEELSVKQWLAILIRARDRGLTELAAFKDLSVQEGKDVSPSLAGFNGRLELRKRMGKLGAYQGVKPPEEGDVAKEGGDATAEEDAAGWEDYALSLT